MHVHEALSTRLSVRDFLSTPVSGEVVREILTAAARAPSGGNLQPWHVAVVAGEPLTRLKSLMKDRVAACPEGEPVEYDVYPTSLHSPYRERRFEVGEDMYRLLGIPREDKPARRAWFARNYQFFGAPLALFCSVDRRMGPPQWSDLGMFLQSVMLLLRDSVERYVRFEVAMLTRISSDHRDIFEAFRRGNAELVGRLSKRHCERISKSITARLRKATVSA